MDAFQSAFLDPVIGNRTEDSDEDLIIEQEEKIVDADGNVKIKTRTLKNPTQEELETKTLDELEDDVDDPVRSENLPVQTITTIQTIRLTDNDLSDHAFSTFGLTDPKDVSQSWFSEDGTTTGYVKGFFWFILKILMVLGKNYKQQS